jgi:ATP-dependent Lon protease
LSPKKAKIPKTLRVGTVPARTAEPVPFDGFPLPVIPLRDMVLFPGTVSPLLLGRPQSVAALSQALAHPERCAFFTLQTDAREEDPAPEALKATGVVGRILSDTPLPGGLCKILVEAVAAGVAQNWTRTGPFLSARGETRDASALEVRSATALSASVAGLESEFSEYAARRADMPPALPELVRNLSGPLEKIYAVAGHLRLPATLRQILLETPGAAAKLSLVREFLHNESDADAAARRMEHEVRAGIAHSQKEFFLTEQLRKIQAELGGNPPSASPEIRKLEAELRARGLPEKALERGIAELRRLDYVHPSSPEYAVVRTYVDWLLALPWNITTEDHLDIAKVKARLDKDHFGLADVKDRILEHVAVFKLARHPSAPILCLAGPPGTGKTSLGRSVAAALGRSFVRISLGGLRDEAEIRGHRRTYIGSMPGRIAQALKKCQTMNPVILLDEVDKMGGDFRGDPASALLEVLDLEQNHDFMDHFLEIGIDLSRVFFITTANVEERIPPALRDRMEVIRISGYYDPEKREIARRHLLPRIRETAGLTEAQLRVPEAALNAIVRGYTHEAGVRQLQQQLAKLARKRARTIVSGGKLAPVEAKSLRAWLGLPPRLEKNVPMKQAAGLVTGLAWTPVGGETLRVECALLSGRGKLTLTGNLGEVMKESAHIALTLARSRAQRFGVDPALFQKTDIHMHVPEGAISKDGPSAGVAMTLALISAMTRKPVDPRLAFTGEVSLSGKLHAVGGLAEKAIAALQAGVTRVCVPGENAPEITELPKEARRGLKILPVETIDDALKLAFGKTGGAGKTR